MSRFSQQVWRATAGLRAAIHALPFNTELAAGSLAGERFRHYITQDALYLGQFSRCLAIAAGEGARPRPSAILCPVGTSRGGRRTRPARTVSAAVRRRSREPCGGRAGARLPRLYEFFDRHRLS